MSRSAENSHIEFPQRPLELYKITGAPSFDTDAQEWTVTGIPVRSLWGFVSGSGEWMGGGDRGAGKGMVKRRWRVEGNARESTLWVPDWIRVDDAEEAIDDPPPLAVSQRVYVARVDGFLCVIRSGGDANKHFGKLDSDLAYNNATGVTVSIWKGKPAADTTENIDNVILSELLMTSGTISSGEGVLIDCIDGRWYVVGVPCG